jgi:RNA polymerase sigma-70 factor, ECF subfamily
VDSPAQERVLGLPILWGKDSQVRNKPSEDAMDPCDEAVLVRVCAGDKDALAVLFDRYSQLLFRVVYRVLDDFGEAEELVQDVFLRLYEKSSSFDPAKGSAKPWMVSVAYRRALDRRTYLIRRRFRSGTNLDLVADFIAGDANLEEDLASSSNRRKLEQALVELPEKQRATLELYFFEGLELKEISGRLGETLPNVRHYYYRGLERLRKSAFVAELRDRQP